MAGEEYAPLEPAPVAGLRLGVPQGLLLTGFRQHGRHALRRRDARSSPMPARGMTDEPMPLFDEMLAVNAKGGFAPAEAFAIHRERLARRARRVRSERARRASSAAANCLGRRLCRHVAGARRGWSARWTRSLRHFDAWMMPTTPIVAPTIAEMQDTRHIQHQEHAVAAQYLDLEFLRHLRDLDPDSGQRAAGRADAGRRATGTTAACSRSRPGSSGCLPRERGSRGQQDML